MPKGSLVLAISGSYGVPAFLAVDACIHDGFIGFRDVSTSIDPEFLYLVMLFRRPYFDDVVKDSGLKNLTTEHLKRLTVPLFPFDVQHRIVAKVDELMALCDRLEASLTTTDDTRRRLLEALLARPSRRMRARTGGGGMTVTNLGRLDRVELRDIWLSEASHLVRRRGLNASRRSSHASRANGRRTVREFFRDFLLHSGTFGALPFLS